MRYLITGGSGYIGTRLVELLAAREDTEKIVICDVVPPRGGYQPKTEFERVDVRDRGAVHSALQRANPDVLVHLAFILNPSHDEGFMYDVDVNGTHNVLEAAAEAGIGQVLVTTSGVAYGAFPDNPEPITEDHPVRGVARFSYARDKTESDRIVQLWALQHPDVITTIVRPCIVFGPNVDNYLVRLWSKAPFAVDAGNLDGRDPVRARGRRGRGDQPPAARPPRGPVQPVAADGLMTPPRVRRAARHARSAGCRCGSTGRSRRLLGACACPRRRPAQIDFELYPWILSNEKLKKTLGWTPGTRRARPSRSRCERRASCRRPSRPASSPPAEDPELYSAALPGR